MTGVASLVPRIDRLEWDSAHFGFEVFSVRESGAEDKALRSALEVCRRSEATLVYWAASPGRVAVPTTLETYGGAVVDEKTTYGREMEPASDEELPRAGERFSLRTTPPCTELLELALAAGEFSRFRVDQRMPKEVFPALYEAWIRRSCSGEIADAVIESRSVAGTLDGMVTVAIDGRVGSIGLIAVHARARGRGLGWALVREAERFMRSRGANRSTVVTQGANRAACRLYESCGYEVIAVANVHHFWLR